MWQSITNARVNQLSRPPQIRHRSRHLCEASGKTLLMSACDQLLNARPVVDDLESPDVGSGVFERFTGRREQTLGHFESLSKLFTRRKIARGSGV